MGDARRPFGISDHSPFTFLEDPVTLSSSSDPYMSDSVEQAIYRLHSLSHQAASSPDRFSRRFFWYYLRRELESLQSKRA